MRWILVTMALVTVGCSEKPAEGPTPGPGNLQSQPLEEQPYSFKEFTVGQTTLDEVKAAHPKWEFKEEARVPGMVTATATDEVTLAGSVASKAEFHFLDGALFKVYVTFPPEGFSTVADAISKKWGAPKTANHWENSVSTIGLVSGDSAIIQVDHTKLNAEQVRRFKQKSEKDI